MNTFCPLPCCRTSRFLLVLLTLLILLPLAAHARIPVVGPGDTEVVSAQVIRYRNAQGQLSVAPDLAIKGRILIEAQPGASVADLDAALQRIGGSVLHAFRTPGQYLVALPEGMTVKAGLALWRAEAAVKLASPDRLMYELAVPNDALYSQQYHLPLLDCPTAWDAQQGSPDLLIGILDSGVDITHEDLAPRMWVNPGEIAGNGVDDDSNGFVDDVNGYDLGNDDSDPSPDPASSGGSDHGTHVAGCAAAASNNSLGVAAPNWGSRIVAIKARDSSGAYSYATIVASIDYARIVGVDVLNISLGGSYDDIFTSPITAAWSAGMSVVCAAGNDGTVFTDDPGTWMSPVCNDGASPADNHVIGVGATDGLDVVADFSNLDGSSRHFVDVMAPGVNILSTLPDRPADGYTQKYGEMSGTSMAAPVCAGVVALVRSQFRSFTPSETLLQLVSGCVNIDATNPGKVGTMGAGRINAANALGDLPPGPPRSLLAFDTPGDEGGSITLTWNLSVDDGKGANDVVSYEIRRGTDASSLKKIAEVPAGTSGYVDTDVIDYSDYFYQVVAHDQVNASATAVVGPVQAKDDLAPPAVVATAVDTPNDSGGSITVSWNSYAPPDDFLQYRIYRSESEFDNINDEGVTRIATVANRNTRTYVDRPVTDNHDYWYAVTAVDDSPEPNELAEVTASGPVRANPNFSLTYPAGLSMFALGLQTLETDLGVLFGKTPPAVEFARWDPAQGDAGSYHLYSANPADPFLGQALGRGFWLRSSQAGLLNISGVPATGEVAVNLVAGWNQLGNPFDQPVAIADLRVKVAGVTYDLATAARKGYTADYCWVYDSFSAGYRLVSAVHGFAQTQVRKGEGFFFFANRAAQLLIPLPSATAETVPVTARRGTPSESDWNLQLVATVQGAADADNFLGVSPQAERLNGVVSPPLVADGVDLFFPAEGGRYATSYRGDLGPGQTWDFRVQARAGATVRLAWPDLSQLPRGFSATLQDRVSGKRVYLRTSSAYEFTLGDSETERHFVLEIRAKAGDLLAIRSLSVQPAAAAVQISYTLSAPATVSVDVLNLAGRPVRVLPAAQQEAGLATTLWDGRGTNGAKVPAGAYLVRITARSAEGQVVSAVRTVQVP